jgi:beta-fructofuranosidase
MDKKSFELKSHEEKELETQVFEAQITPEENEFELWLRKDVHIKYSHKVFSLELGESGYGRTIRNCKIPEIHKMAIFSDTSSLEIFLNEGEKVLSTRLFDDASDTMIKADSSMYVDFFPLKAFHVED